MGEVINIADAMRRAKTFAGELADTIAAAITHDELDAIELVLRDPPAPISIWQIARLDAELARRRRALLAAPSDGGHAA